MISYWCVGTPEQVIMCIDIFILQLYCCYSFKICLSRFLYDLYFYNTIIIAISENFYWFCSNLHVFPFLFATLSMLYKTMLNKWWVGSPLSFHDLTGIGFIFSSLNWCQLSDVLIDLSNDDILSIQFYFDEGFYHKWRWIMSYAFFCICWDDHTIFILHFLSVL